jgi:hypothetical protein
MNLAALSLVALATAGTLSCTTIVFGLLWG